jgi:hypothetical protein
VALILHLRVENEVKQGLLKTMLFFKKVYEKNPDLIFTTLKLSPNIRNGKGTG